MTKLDESIRQQVGLQEVPLRVKLADTEVTTLRPPPPVYLLASRESFLPVIGKQLLEYFQHALPPGDLTPWFDASGSPLKWQFPLGVLYDLHSQNADGQPWRVTVHFRDFPQSELLGLEEASLRSSFVNSLKEAAFALTGSASKVMSSRSQMDAAWECLDGGDWSGFCRKVAEIDLSPSTNANRSARIPMRVLIASLPEGAGSSSQYITVITRPISTCTSGASAENTTLINALHEAAPNIFSSNDLAKNMQSEEMEEKGDSLSPPEDCGAACVEELNCFPSNVCVTVSGVHPPPSSPLAWLHDHFKHSDNFLYIVVHMGQVVSIPDDT